jgi:hypothetical protein
LPVDQQSRAAGPMAVPSSSVIANPLFQLQPQDAADGDTGG